LLITFELTNQSVRKALFTCVVYTNYYCYTSQLKYVFRLEENVSRVVGQNSLTP